MKIKMKNYGALTTGDEKVQILLSPQPYQPEYWFPDTAVTFYTAFISDKVANEPETGKYYYPYTYPHFVTVNGTFHIDWKETPIEIDVEVPDDFKEEVKNKLFKPSNI